MPVYRGEQWIGGALESLAAEADRGIEILVVDGGPTPVSLNIAQRYGGRLRLRLFQRHDLLTWQDKTNFGVRAASATHVCWLHVDDLWLRGRAAAVRSWIGSDSQAPLHLAPSVIIDASGRKIGTWRCPLPAGRDLDSTSVLKQLLVQNFISAPAPVFRKEAWLTCGGLDPALWYTADWDMWLKLAAQGPVRYHDQITTAYRIHGSSLTTAGSRDIDDFARQMLIVLDRHLGVLGCRSKEVERLARASIAVNTALAAAAGGNLKILPRGVLEVLLLGPSGIRRYFRDARLAERVLSRLWARLRGGF